MKKQVTLLGCVLSTFLSYGQLIEENFDSGIPGDWTQWSGDGITWTDGDNVGVGESGCALADLSDGSGEGTAWLQTPLMDLSEFEDVEITFSAGVVLNNFLHPSVSLWYDIGGGWVYLSNWGPEWGDFDNDIVGTNDYEPPLDYANVGWNEGLTFDLSGFDGVSSIRFSFGSDFVNGGYVVVDDVSITGTFTGDDAGIFDPVTDDRLTVYPNPSTGRVFVEKEGVSIDEVKVLNMLGQEVGCYSLNVNDDRIELDLNDLETGTYTLLFLEDGERRSSELITLK